MSTTQGQTVPVVPLPDDVRFLDVVTEWDPGLPWDQWTAQMLVPATFRPVSVPRVIAIANQKGGAGKTTTTVEFAAALAARGLRVRMIGADPQRASLPAWLEPAYPEGLEPKQRRTLTHVFFGNCSLADATYPTKFKGLYIVPGGTKLGRVESENQLVGRESCIQRGIAQDPSYDVNLIDCGPTLGVITVSALAAAEDVIVPTLAGRMDLLGVSDLHRSFTRVKETLNPKLEVRAIVLNEWDRTSVMQKTAFQVVQDYPHAIVAPVHRSTKIKEAVGEYLPTRLYAPRSKPSIEFDQLVSLYFGDVKGVGQ
ncbi:MULTISPECIES: ParA family protein [unclassified Streptomyces]|uniref:ParA family protein n=1 Tax=unclassified Streptomyces TaxID=2593676 RepID=UPI000BE3CA99|nr:MULTISPECIES: ParA family protein [unclassified Streptomyces]